MYIHKAMLFNRLKIDRTWTNKSRLKIDYIGTTVTAS